MRLWDIVFLHILVTLQRGGADKALVFRYLSQHPYARKWLSLQRRKMRALGTGPIGRDSRSFYDVGAGPRRVDPSAVSICQNEGSLDCDATLKREDFSTVAIRRDEKFFDCGYVFIGGDRFAFDLSE